MQQIKTFKISSDTVLSLNTRVLVFLLSTALIYTPTLMAAGVQTDGTTQTTLDHAANGVEIVNIANPNAQGLSHNRYKQFNVSNQGLILNNARSTTVKTELGGYIYGNAQLTNNAKVILNEVTSSARTQLLGYTEVAGKRADLVIANPNGITVNGAGFINTANVTLTTAKPNILNGKIDSYNLSNKEIAIEGAGLDAAQTDSALLYTKLLKLNAKIYANKLNLNFGSLDASALGGMYAGAITLVGTDKGVGVNLPPEVLASNGDISITADGDIKLHKVSASQDITVATSQNIEVNNQLTSANNINLEATDITNNSLINSANDVNVQSTNFTNNNTVFSGNDITMHIANSFKNTQGSDLFAIRNILIDGDKAGGIKTKSIDNIIANIQSINGDINIYANQLNNIGEATLDYQIWYQDVLNGETSINYSDLMRLSIAYNTHGWYENSPGGALYEWKSNIASIMKKRLPEIDSSVYAGKSYFDFLAIKKFYVSNTTMNFAKIQSNNNINLHIDKGLNKDGYIYAGKDLGLDVKENLKVTATNETVKGSGYKYIVQAAGRSWSCDCYTNFSGHHCDSCWAFNTNQRYVEQADDITVYADSLVSAGENIVQENGSLEVDGSTDASVVTELNKVDDALAKTQPATDYQLPIDDNGLFVLSQDPSSRYLIETNPQFANLNNFISSKYLLERLGYDAEREAKILGDGLYEQRLIQNQILQQTGKAFLDPQYTDNQAIYQNLLDNAYQAQQDLQLSVGISLSKEQINALTQDIVWMEEKEVQGQKVLVPVLYLANKQHYKISGGSIVAGDDITLQIDNLSNSGNLQAGKNITVQSDIITNKKEIMADESVQLVAQTDINNLSGTIRGKQTYVESLKGDVNNVTLAKSAEYKAGNYNVQETRVAQTATIGSTAGDTTIKAKGDISNRGSKIEAHNGTVTLATTNGDVNMNALQINKSANAVFNGGFSKLQQRNYKTSAVEGKNIVVKSGNNVKVESANIVAKNSINIDAANNVDIAAVQTLDTTDEQYTSSTSGLTSKTTISRMAQRNEKAVVSQLSATDISIKAKNRATLQASNLTADKDINIQAKKIDVLAVNNTNYSETHSSSKGLLSSKSQTDIKLSQATKSSSLTADNIRLKSTDDINLEATKISANKAIELKSEHGDVNLLAKSYTNAIFHESKKSSFGGLSSSHSIDALSQTKLAGSAASAKNNIMVGGKDITVIASSLESQEGELALDAKNNINISAANESSSEQHLEEKKNFSLALSGSKLTYATITKDTNTHTTTTNKASNLSAKNITLKSAADTNIIASDLKAESINVDAKKDFNLLAAKNTAHTTREHSKKDLGVEVTLNSKEASAFTGYWEEANGQSTTKKDVAKSTLDAGTLSVKATNTNIVGSDILTNNAQIDSKNIQLLATTASIDTQRYTKSIKTGVKVGVTQNISNAIDKMKNIGDAKSGTGTAARTLKAYDAINSFLQKPVDAGVYAIYEESKTSTNEHQEQAVASKLYANNNAALHAKKKLEVGGSDIYTGKNLDIQAKDINLHATTANYSSSTTSSSKNAKASLYGSDMGTLTLAFQNSSNKIEGTTHSNTHITALGKATLTSTTLKGAVVDANDLELSAGRNLVMQSMQDTQTIRGKSKGGSVSVNVLTAAPQGASANYGSTKGDKAWVNEVTSLNAQNSIRVSVGDTTILKGASITNTDASGTDRGNLRLTTKKLIAEDIQDHDNYKSTNVAAGVGSIDSKPSLNSIEFADSTKDKAQIVRATIGKGVITTTSNTSNINQDISKTKQLTKDESSDIELYASDSSINALTHPIQTYKDMKQKAKDVGLASHIEILQSLPTAKGKTVTKMVNGQEVSVQVREDGSEKSGFEKFVDNTLGEGLDTIAFLGILPSKLNDGGYVSQIATQVFGDNRAGITTDNKEKLNALGLKERQPGDAPTDWDYEKVTLVKTDKGIKPIEEAKTENLKVLDTMTLYRTNPDKQLVIEDGKDRSGNPALEAYKMRVSAEDMKKVGIDHLFTNGMYNSHDTAVYNQQTQQGYADAVLNYNQQHGIAGDLIEDAQDHLTINGLDMIKEVVTFGKADGAVDGIGTLGTGGSRQTGELIDQMMDITEGDLVLGAHSQGTMMTQNGLDRYQKEITTTLQNNKNAKLLIQYSGAPVNHVIAENKVKEIYGGENAIKQHTRNQEAEISDVFRSNVTPNDFVGSVLGYQGAGVNNSENLGEAMWESLLSSPRLFGFGDPSSHSYYPCVIGCGKDKFTPEKGNYNNPNAPDGTKQSPMTHYYKENFEVTRPDGTKEMTIDIDLLPDVTKREAQTINIDEVKAK